MLKKLKEQLIELFRFIPNQIKDNPLGSLMLLVTGSLLIWILWNTIRLRNTGFSNKTLWNWTELLLVPVLLAVGVYFLNASQRKAERENEKNREFQTTLEAYYDRMRDLLLKEGLRNSQKESEVRIIARSLSLAVLKSLDAKRKGQVIQFLQESKLIRGPSPILSLRGADLREADLSFLDLKEIMLMECRLEGANLHYADLKGADLSISSLSRANLSNANLANARLTLATCDRTNCEGALFWNANLHRTSFHRANLRGVMLGGSKIRFGRKDGDPVRLLLDANIDETNFYKADLSDAHIGIEQLTNAFLKKTRMPDGSSYERWLSTQNEEFQQVRKEADNEWEKRIRRTAETKRSLV